MIATVTRIFMNIPEARSVTHLRQGTAAHSLIPRNVLIKHPLGPCRRLGVLELVPIPTDRGGPKAQGAEVLKGAHQILGESRGSRAVSVDF